MSELEEILKRLDEQTEILKVYETNKKIDNLISMLIIGLGVFMSVILKAWVVVGILAPIFILGTTICYFDFFKNIKIKQRNEKLLFNQL